MQLVIDIGNTRSKLALFSNHSMEELLITESPDLTVLRHLFDEYPDIDSVILSSVKPHDPSLDQWLSERARYVALSAHTPLPFRSAYETPHSLGKDRIAAVAGAMHLKPGVPLLVIDAGTCITYDFVDAEGVYQGGSISPGMHMRFRAMHTFTGSLPFIQTDAEASAPLTGKSTIASMESGVKVGILAEAEGVIERYKAICPDLQVVVSGGDYKYFEKNIKSNIFATPNIVIQGLKKILDFNE